MPCDHSKQKQDSAAAILLASGFSKRFGGQNKLLLPFRGKPLARYTLELAAAQEFSGRKFSVGVFFIAASDDVAALAKDLPGVTVIKNLSPEKGQRESVRLGVEAAAADYYMFFVCDQPLLDEDTVGRILEARRQGCIVEPRYKGRPGNPCLFSNCFREELLSLREGETPRLIKERHKEAIRGIEVSPLALRDIDDMRTLEQLLEQTLNLPPLT